MHLGGKCKISWSNDDFQKSGYFVPPTHESIRSQGTMADRVKNAFRVKKILR